MNVVKGKSKAIEKLVVDYYLKSKLGVKDKEALDNVR